MLYDSPQNTSDAKPAAETRANDIRDLHDRCGVYTQPTLVRRTLDACGWKPAADLSQASLLEPCAGDGSFLSEAVLRLMRSLKNRGITPNLRILKDRILAFELVGAEATKARNVVAAILVSGGLKQSSAKTLTKVWIRTGDFLLRRRRSRRFTHVVGNPPYVRWSRVPRSLRSKYEAMLLPTIARGDLQLPFLSEGVNALSDNGCLAYICSDRWRHMSYGAEFKTALHRRTRVEIHPIRERPPFSRPVGAYADLLVVTNVAPTTTLPSVAICSTHQTLSELGCRVKVGPALGCERAFVGKSTELPVESNLLTRFIRPKQIHEGAVFIEDLWVIAMHDENGKLRDLKHHPKLEKHLESYSKELRARSIVANGRPWYSPIDRVQRDIWSAPKILIPEIAKVPRLAMDRSATIPSHGVYAIFGPEGILEEVHQKLAHGGLAHALDPIAPRLKGGYVRCYRRFLEMMSI